MNIRKTHFVVQRAEFEHRPISGFLRINKCNCSEDQGLVVNMDGNVMGSEAGEHVLKPHSNIAFVFQCIKVPRT